MPVKMLAALAVAGTMIAAVPAAMAGEIEEVAAYAPAPGDSAVIYSHRFTAETFDEGLRIVKEGFTDAQSEMGQTRKNYFLVDPAQFDVVVVSFFGEDADVDEWHDFVGRMQVLETLAPMRRAPLEVEPFTVDTITTAP